MAHCQPRSKTPQETEKSMNTKSEANNRDFLIAALLFLGVAAAILVPLYLAYPPVPS